MTISIRLASMFALVSVLLLGGIGVYLFHSLQQEIIWRDDQALKGRLERIHAIIRGSDNLVELGQQPQLYENMLGNRDNLLWVLDQQGQAIIEINPPRLLPPKVQPQSTVKLLN